MFNELVSGSHQGPTATLKTLVAKQGFGKKHYFSQRLSRKRQAVPLWFFKCLGVNCNFYVTLTKLEEYQRFGLKITEKCFNKRWHSILVKAAKFFLLKNFISWEWQQRSIISLLQQIARQRLSLQK